MIASFTLSEETVDRLLIDQVRTRHGFDEEHFEVKIERSDDDRKEKIVRIYVSEKF